MRFGDLDFIVMMERELALAPTAAQPLPYPSLDAIAEALEELQLHALEAHAPGGDQLLGFDYGRLERQLSAFLGPQPSREDLRHLTFSFANVIAQLTGREPFSLEYPIQSALTVLLFGLCNAAETVGHLVAQRMIPSPTNDEFMGVNEHVAESFHDLLAEEPESPSCSDSIRGSHHPSREWFLTGTPEGYIEGIH